MAYTDPMESTVQKIRAANPDGKALGTADVSEILGGITITARPKYSELKCPCGLGVGWDKRDNHHSLGGQFNFECDICGPLRKAETSRKNAQLGVGIHGMSPEARAEANRKGYEAAIAANPYHQSHAARARVRQMADQMIDRLTMEADKARQEIIDEYGLDVVLQLEKEFDERVKNAE